MANQEMTEEDHRDAQRLIESAEHGGVAEVLAALVQFLAPSRPQTTKPGEWKREVKRIGGDKPTT